MEKKQKTAMKKLSSVIVMALGSNCPCGCKYPRGNTIKRNFQKLAIEMFKVNNGLSVQLFSEKFHFAENHYNFRHQSGTKFKVDHVKTEAYGKQSI